MPTLFPSISLDTPGPTVDFDEPRYPLYRKTGERTRNNDTYAFMTWDMRGHWQVAQNIVDI